MIQSVLETNLPFEPRRGRVLDVGCGTGLVLQAFEEWEPIGLDFSKLALNFCQSRGLNKNLRADVTRLPFESNSMDLILALDLIEHVERHDLLIREFHRVLRPGGCAMITVPAHPYLWSDHDLALHHFRRFTMKSFRKMLRHGKLKPIKLSYGICFLHPIVVTFRMTQKAMRKLRGTPKNHTPKAHLVKVPKLINWTLLQILKLETKLMNRTDLPQGTSIVALVQKKENPR